MTDERRTEWYKPEELAVRLQLNVRTLIALARKGEFPGGRKFGNQWRFNAHVVDAWLSEQSSVGGAPASPKSPDAVIQAKLDGLKRFRIRRTK